MKKLTTFLMTAALLLVGSAAMAGEKSVTICHIPPGNTGNPQSISVGESSVPAHLAHGDQLAGEEVCDGVDNDCDGTVDDDPTDVGGECTVGVGACEATGTLVCVDGELECDAEAGEPSEEICDELDNDCDGDTNEGGVCTPISCEAQICSTYTLGCGGDSGCVCAKTPDGSGVCVNFFAPCPTSSTCSSNADCAPNEACQTENCCGPGINLCAPLCF